MKVWKIKVMDARNFLIFAITQKKRIESLCNITVWMQETLKIQVIRKKEKKRGGVGVSAPSESTDEKA